MRRWIGRWLRLHARLTLLAFGIRIDTENIQAVNQSPAFIVSNHLGYLDALVISSLVPASFVTSVEMRDAFFIGWLTKVAGCLYVERRNRENLGSEVSGLTLALKSGVNVCVFPEATSTSGESVLRFRRPLYAAAIESNTAIVPLCLNYESVDGEPVTVRNRDSIFWYGDMSFFSHLWSFWKLRTTRVRVSVGSPIQSKLQDTTTLADTSHRIVSARYRPISNPLMPGPLALNNSYSETQQSVLFQSP